jgi:nitrite reductase/ring-hydroxylating ferredoxin subunit
LSFVKVVETSEIPPRQMKAIGFAEKDILIANVDGAYHAIGSICTQVGGAFQEGT